MRSSSITQGSPDAGDAAVVAIVVGTSPHCTGTLIAPHTVLTAAHCAVDASNYDAYQVFFGTTVGAGGATLDISEARIDPAFDQSALSHDLELLTLRQAAPVPPVPFDSAPVDGSRIGQTFSIVGFGVSDPSLPDGGVKRTGAMRVSAVDALGLTAVPAPSQPCVLDSGGPALFAAAGGTVLGGVVSHGDAACLDHAVFSRIDIERAGFIDPYLAATAPGTADVGQRCLYDQQCRSGACLPVAHEPRLWFCSQPCRHDSDCPAPMSCAADGCRYRDPAPGATGWPCALPSDCASATCRTGSCTRRCNPAAPDCPSGFSCQNSGGIEFDCRRAPHQGCAVDGSADGAPLLPTLLLLLLVIALHRARCDSSRPA